MADVITRFKLETTQFDSKLRDTAKDLQGIAKQAEKAGKDFAGFDKRAVEAARALGTVASGATNTKDKLRDLVGSFNDAAKAYNKLTEEQKQSDFGKAMAESLQKLQQEIKQTKDELYGLGDAAKGKGGGGLFSGMGDKMSGALQVFAGNMLTKAAGAVVSLGSEMADMVKQGVEMAKAGEGIRIAFERLGRGDILDGLREATHGTVTDLELMKAAVKFNDFKLPVEELGTMLAFAQQKAKDTGQSVDYMVDSIVTGLGRKSLMILDNLGLSATDVKERMKETGDMTKAVGQIIREQMSKAGDYVETAADRATKADVDLKNAMEDLGRTFQPLSDAGASLWNNLKIGALDLLNNAVRPLIDALTEAGRIRSKYAQQGGDRRVNGFLDTLKGISNDDRRRDTYNRQLGKFDSKIGLYQQYLEDYKKWQNDKTAVGAYDRMQAFQKQTKLSFFSDVKEQLAVFQKQRAEYVMGAKAILEGTPAPSPADSSDGKGGKGGKGGKTGTDINYATDSIMAQQAEVSRLTKLWQSAGAAVRDDYKAQLDEAQYLLDRMTGKEKFDPTKMGPIADLTGRVPMPNFGVDMKRDKNGKWYDATAPVAPSEIKFSDSLQKFMDYMEKLQVDDYKKRQSRDGLDDTKKVVSGLGQVASGLQQMGIELPKGVQQVLGMINGLMTVIEGVNTIIGVTQTTTLSANTAAMVALTSALYANTAVSAIPFFAHGGVVKAAFGYEVPGNHFSGDMVPALLNSGETVLNRAQSGIIASALEGAGTGNMSFELKASGENLIAVIDRTGKRKGMGELCWWKN